MCKLQDYSIIKKCGLSGIEPETLLGGKQSITFIIKLFSIDIYIEFGSVPELLPSTKLYFFS